MGDAPGLAQIYRNLEEVYEEMDKRGKAKDTKKKYRRVLRK